MLAPVQRELLIPAESFVDKLTDAHLVEPIGSWHLAIDLRECVQSFRHLNFMKLNENRDFHAFANHANYANFADLANHANRSFRISDRVRESFQPNLNCCLLIFKALIRLSSVDGGIRSLAAAPDGPETRPLVSASAASIIFRALRGSRS